jgi:hypothetical protein
MYYILCHNTPRFFSSLTAAQEEAGKQFMICDPEIRPVPLGRTRYSVAYRHPDIVEVRFYIEEMAKCSFQIKKIEVEK